MKRAVVFALVLLLLLAPGTALAKKKDKAAEKDAEPESPLAAGTLAGLAFRGIGPALMSGRVADIAVDPTDHDRWIVGVASGGVWQTWNAGTTWTPVFDGQPSYSVGCVTIDPNDPMIVWVGTGENNSQRSVAYGDGVYKSIDGGRTWTNVGLPDSEHIGMIAIDPRDSDTVFVAAQGPLWRAGGDRGLYKTEDGGKNWKRVLEIDEHTGVNEVLFDPRDPDTMLATSYQRRRRTWTLINGGPGSGVWRSTDAGETWERIQAGLPEGDLGRIGLAAAPSAPGTFYAIVEATEDKGGFFRSVNGGVTWEKRSGYVAGSPQYYNEIVVDPHDASRVYAMDTFMQVTEDGGATFRNVGETWKHVDNHSLWIDPENTAHMVAGCDGGVYETVDRGATWDFFANLPITQFYKLSLDNDTPFYNVYGGTQDNASLGGPARTTSRNGITNRDWYVTVMGDGFEPQVDPTDPDIVYSQWQNGGLVRCDRASGELIDIQPQPAAGEPPSRWNWSSPLLISPHDPKRLFYASQRVWRSDDRGNSWRAISPDLTRQTDRNTLPVMDKVWSVDAVAKNASTSFYGNIVSVEESPLVENLLYAGTDDGLIQVTENGGESWRAIESFAGVPDRSYVTSITASLHDPDTVYATFDNHKSGDFKPYVLKSADRGRTWTSIAGDLPERGHAHMIRQDHEQASLLFVGTEFGVFFTPDEGGRWVPLKGGLPTIAVRDLEVQRRENDLVLGTFGRGFYVLDDYTPLRGLTEEVLERDAVLFPVRDTPAFMESMELGLPGKSMQGDAFYTAPNPPFGALVTYYLKDEIQTRKKTRQVAEKEKGEAGETIGYPTWEDLRAEDREEPPAIVLTVTDEDGNVVRRVEGPVAKGIHRVAWDLRYPASTPTRLTPWPTDNPFFEPPSGPMAAPGTYTVSMAKRVDGVLTPLGTPQTFEVVSLGLAKLPAADREAVLAFQKKTARLQRAAMGAARAAAEAEESLQHIVVALRDTPAADADLMSRARALQTRLADLRVELQGDRTVARRNEPTPESILDRVNRVVGGHWSSSSGPTETHRRNYEIAAEAFGRFLPELTELIEVDLAGLENRMETIGAPWTPGRVPRWSPE